MTRSNLWSSLAIALSVLVGIPVLARHHVAFTGGARPTAATQPAAAASIVTSQKPLCVQGAATVDATWPIGPDGVELRPTSTSAKALADAAEGCQRVLYVEAESDELGGLAGVLRDSRLNHCCRIGMGELYTDDGDAVRLALKLKNDADLPGHVGTYRVLGGTGKFSHASGSGDCVLVRDTAAPLETVTLTLNGTISY